MREFPRFLLVGVMSGWIAAILARGSVRFRGCVTFVVVGTVGALVGGYVFEMLGIDEVWSVVAATAGAIIFLVLVRTLRRR